MSDYTKKIQIDNNKSVTYTKSKDGFNTTDTISALDLEGCLHHLKLSRWEDYEFSSFYNKDYSDYEELTKESHTFDNNHPLYIPLFHLLRDEEELIIDDDFTSELNENYMRIYQDGNNINIDFINLLDEEPIYKDFKVGIKNVVFDIRSKIDYLKKDTKERLYYFFEEAIKRIEENYHQLSMEEYIINDPEFTKEEKKVYAKKFRVNNNKEDLS